MQHSSKGTAKQRTNYGDAAPQNPAIKRVGAAALITLGEPHSRDLTVALATLIPAWARSPDIYALIMNMHPTQPEGGIDPADLPLACVAEQLQLYWRLECFPKPVVSLLDGAVDAFAAGLTTFGTHRVAGGSYRFSLPSLPDLTSPPASGIAYALARLPHATVTDLMNGRSIDRAEAWAAGLVTHCIPAAAFAAIIDALADGQPVDPLLDGLHVDPQLSPERRGESDATARLCSPLMALIDAARTMDVRDNLIATHRLAAALRCEQRADESFLMKQIFSKPEFGELELPQRSEL